MATTSKLAPSDQCSTQDSVMEVGSERPPKGTSKQGRPKGKHQKERKKPSMQQSRPAAISDEEVIKEFLECHTKHVKKGMRNVYVKTLRHIIPIFIRVCFNLKADQTGKKKVRGMWEKPPSGWDPTVPFLDPNNQGDQGRPGQEVLMQMFEYLHKCYVQRGSRLHNQLDVNERRPMDSNLLEDRKKHIESKLLSIQSHNDIDVLNEAKDVLFRLFDQLGKNEWVIETLEFICTLDIVIETNSLPPNHIEKWRKFVAERNMRQASCPETRECSASASVPNQMEQIEDMSSRLSSLDDESAGTSDAVRKQTFSNCVECSDDVGSEVNGNDPGNEPGLSTLNGKVHQQAEDLEEMLGNVKIMQMGKDIESGDFDVLTGQCLARVEGLPANTSLENYAHGNPMAVHKGGPRNKRYYWQVGTSEKPSTPKSLDETRQSHPDYTDAEMPPAAKRRRMEDEDFGETETEELCQKVANLHIADETVPD